MIRKTIFKDELRYVFSLHPDKLTEGNKDRVIHAIFENPLTLSKQYMLKKELNHLDDLSAELSKILLNREVVGAINNLFLIQDDLELPAELKNMFLRNEKVGVFVGAGVSKLLGIPLWGELGDRAIEYLYKINRINYFEYQRIIGDVIDPKQKLTIFHKLLPKNTTEAKEFYQKALVTAGKQNIKNPYDLIVEIGWIKFSSNIDMEFFNAIRRKLEQSLIVSEQSSEGQSAVKKKEAKTVTNNFDLNHLDYETVYQIHGSVDNLENSILTTEDYIKAYYEESELKRFLNKLFREYTIIFVGYGLEEFSILEHIIKTSKKHYALISTYLNEMNLFRLHSEYFNTLNIKPIPFYLDFSGYERLISVIDAWNQQINESRIKDYYQKVQIIDKLVD
ncbi:MAG: hypothetical protein AUK38_02955 [Nitrospirae bacterium CG2_30_41_42]|nr:MAG: hypothetical protein AUK38_02955 [Nitrospirae bacterium CG2_30_41_42]